MTATKTKTQDISIIPESPQCSFKVNSFFPSELQAVSFVSIALLFLEFHRNVVKHLTILQVHFFHFTTMFESYPHMCTLAFPPLPCYAWVSVFAHSSEQLREVLGDLQVGANRDTHGGPYGTRKHQTSLKRQNAI